MNTGSVLAQFTITLTQAVSEPVLVDWYTSDGTAKAGVDYAAGKGTATFAPGETSKTISILVYGRAVGSEDRSFFVEMLPPVNAILGASIGECIIHVDTTGSTPVTVIVVPSGPRGLEGKSAYQVWLDLGNTGTEQDFIDSLSPPIDEIAAEVAPLIDVGNTTLTAQGTESLGHPDATNVKAVARRIAYVDPAKIATVLLADGDNIINPSVLTGDAIDTGSVGLYPRIVRGTQVISPQWFREPDGDLLIKSAIAGDVLYVCQYDLLSATAILNQCQPVIDAAVSPVKEQSREALRRGYAEAGFTMVAGSFELGGTVASSTSVLLYEAEGKAYSWDGALPKVVPDGSTPASTGGVGAGAWVLRTSELLRSQLALANGYQMVGGAAAQSDMTILQRNNNASMAVIAGKLIANTAAGTKVHFFGDSTMWGSNPAPNTTVQQATNPPAMFKIALDILYPGNGVTTSNRAIAGSSLYSMLRGINHYYPNNYENMLQMDTPAVAYCGHCLNDCSSVDSETNIAQYYADLISFVDITRAYGAIPVLVTPSIHAPLGDGTIAQTKRQITFIQAMRDVAEKKSVDLVDCHEFTRRSLNVWTPMSVAPDGVHLSPMFSSQLGFNMLIPLVKPKVLEHVGDIAGLSSTIWNDNLPNVPNKITNNASSRFGPLLLGDGGASDLKINFPVILADGTKDNFVAFGGSAWNTHGKSSITYFDGYGTATVIDGDIDASTQVTTSDAIFAPARCQLPAGLAIIGVKLPGVTQVGKVFTFSGLTLLPKKFSGHGKLAATDIPQIRPILAGDTVTTTVTLTSGSSLMRFCDADNTATNVIEVKWDGTSNKVVIVSPAGTRDLWASPVANSVFGLELNIEQRSITVSMGGLSQTISGLSYSLPKLLVNSPTPYSVMRG